MKRLQGTLSAALFLCATLTRAASYDDVTLTLAADRPRYYVGEPVRLTLTIKNDSERVAVGFFQLGSSNDHVDIMHRRAKEGFRPLWRDRSVATDLDILRAPMRIQPSDERQSEVTVATDLVSRRLVLGEPGEYEFYVISEPLGKGRGSLTSNIIGVRVDAPPEGQREAFSEYVSRSLAFLVQFSPFPPLNQESIASAASFIDHHPQGPYSDHVRKALIGGLKHRIRRGHATSEDKELYRRLRSEAP